MFLVFFIQNIYFHTWFCIHNFFFSLFIPAVLKAHLSITLMYINSQNTAVFWLFIYISVIDSCVHNFVFIILHSFFFLKEGSKNCTYFRSHKIWIRPCHSWSPKYCHGQSSWLGKLDHFLPLLTFILFCDTIRIWPEKNAFLLFYLVQNSQFVSICQFTSPCLPLPDLSH